MIEKIRSLILGKKISMVNKVFSSICIYLIALNLLAMDPPNVSDSGTNAELHQFQFTDFSLEIIAIILSFLEPGTAQEYCQYALVSHYFDAAVNLQNDLYFVKIRFAKKYPKLLKLVESATSNIDTVDGDGRTLLHHALLEGDLDLAELLVLGGIDVNRSSNLQEIPLLEAFLNAMPCDIFSHWGIVYDNGEHKIFDLLIDKGAKIPKSPDGLLPCLHLAVYRSNVKIVLALLRGGSLIDEKNEKGETPLHMAVSKGDIAMVELLLKCGADFTIKNNKDETAINCSSWDEITNLIKKYEEKILVQNEQSRKEAHKLMLNFVETAGTLAMFLGHPHRVEDAAELMVLLKRDPEAILFAKLYIEKHYISIKRYVSDIKKYSPTILYLYQLLPDGFIINKQGLSREN